METLPGGGCCIYLYISMYIRQPYYIHDSPCTIENAHRLPACRMKRPKGFPDGSTSTARDYAGLLCYLYSLGCQRPGCRPTTLPLFSNLPLLHVVNQDRADVGDFLAAEILKYLIKNRKVHMRFKYYTGKCKNLKHTKLIMQEILEKQFLQSY